MRIDYVTVETEGFDTDTMLAKYTVITYKPKEKIKGEKIATILKELNYDFNVENFVKTDGVYEITIYCGDRDTHNHIKNDIYFPIKRSK